MALDLKGLFVDPTQFKQKRVDDLIARRQQLATMGGSMAGLLGQVAGGGTLLGEQLAEGIAGGLGLKTKQEAQAEQLQKVVKDTDFRNLQSLTTRREMLKDAGAPASALFAIDERIRQLQEKARENQRLTAAEQRQIEAQKSTLALQAVQTQAAQEKMQRDTNTFNGLIALAGDANRLQSIGFSEELANTIASSEDKTPFVAAVENQLEKITDPSKGPNPSFASTDLIRDEQGNMFYVANYRDPETQETKAVFSPIGGSKDGPQQPVGDVELVASSGMTPSDRPSVAQAVTEAELYATRKVDAAASIGTLRATKTKLQKGLELLKQVDTGGFTVAIQTEFEKLFGTTPANKAELAKIMGEETFKILKPLFGGIISDSERESVMAFMPGLGQSNEANAALFNQMIATVDTGIANSMSYLDSDSFEDFMKSARGESIVKPESTPPPAASGGSFQEINGVLTWVPAGAN